MGVMTLPLVLFSDLPLPTPQQQALRSYQNDTDTQTDYFDHGRVVLFEDHALYAAARARAEAIKAINPMEAY